MKYILFLTTLYANIAYSQYNLALNLEKNSTYHLKINTADRFSWEADGHPMTGSYNMTGTMNFKVVGVSATGYELEAAYDSIHFVMKSPMGKFEFNSGNDEDGSSVMNTMRDKHIKITLLKNGAVSKIENPDTSGFFPMMKNNPMMNGMKQMMMMGAFKQSFNKETMKENIEKLTAIFPDKKVNINESWGSVIRPDSGSNNMAKTSYQLISYKDGIAVIKGHSETIANSNNSHPHSMGPGMMFPMMMPIYDVKGESESTIEINTSTGWIKEATVKNELKGHVQMNEPNKANKESPVQINGDIKISSY